MAMTASVYLGVGGLRHLENWVQTGLAVDYWLWHHSVCKSSCQILGKVDWSSYCDLRCWLSGCDGLKLNCL